MWWGKDGGGKTLGRWGEQLHVASEIAVSKPLSREKEITKSLFLATYGQKVKLSEIEESRTQSANNSHGVSLDCSRWCVIYIVCTGSQRGNLKQQQKKTNSSALTWTHAGQSCFKPPANKNAAKVGVSAPAHCLAWPSTSFFPPLANHSANYPFVRQRAPLLTYLLCKRTYIGTFQLDVRVGGEWQMWRGWIGGGGAFACTGKILMS